MNRIALLLLVPLAGCTLLRPPVVPTLRYVVGEPYRVDGVWRYPRENFEYSDTGLAAVYDAKPGPTADGEVFDRTALAGAHPSLQLPALARVTNLENGRQVLIRINDRGPADPARLIGITRRTAELLGAADPTAIRVRVQVQEAESRRMATALRQDGPSLAVSAAPAGSVATESLAPPPGAAQSARVQVAASGPTPRASTGTAAPADGIPLRLPEQVSQGMAAPGTLAVECGAFTRADAASVMSRRLAHLGARVTTNYDAPRDRAFAVRIGGLSSVAAAEAMLRRALADNAPDARIVIE